MQPVITRRIDLYGMFLATWPEVDPKLAEDALRFFWEDAELRYLDEGQAIWRIWTEDLSLDGPEVAMYLQRSADVPSSIIVGPDGFERRERIMLEKRVRAVLAAIADKVYRGEAVFTATHPKTHEPFRPDSALLENLTGSERSRDRIATDGGVIRNLRFENNPAHDTAQGKLPLPQQKRPPEPIPPPPEGIESARWHTIWKLYREHVRAVYEEHRRRPLIKKDDDPWRQKPEISVTRDEMRALRKVHRAAFLADDTNVC
jgi:hypothetical protein